MDLLLEACKSAGVGWNQESTCLIASLVNASRTVKLNGSIDSVYDTYEYIMQLGQQAENYKIPHHLFGPWCLAMSTVHGEALRWFMRIIIQIAAGFFIDVTEEWCADNWLPTIRTSDSEGMNEDEEWRDTCCESRRNSMCRCSKCRISRMFRSSFRAVAIDCYCPWHVSTDTVRA